MRARFGMRKPKKVPMIAADEWRFLRRAVLGSGGLRVLGMMLAFLVGVQLARGLSPTGYGVYSLAMSVIAILTVPAEFGVTRLAVREVSKADHSGNSARLFEFVGWSNRLVAIASATVGILLLVALEVFGSRFSSSLRASMAWGIVLIPLTAWGRLQGGILRGLQHLVLGQVSEIIARPLILCGALALLFAFRPGSDPSAVMALNVFAAGIAMLISWILVRGRLNARCSAESYASNAAGWLKSSIPLGLSEVLRVAHGHVAILILGILVGAHDVGIFRVAVSISIFLVLPVTLLDIVSAPTLSHLCADDDHDRLQAAVTRVSIVMATTTLAVMVPFVFFGGDLVKFLFGPSFVSASTPVVILAIGYFVSGCFGPNAVLLNMSGNERRVTIAFAYAAIANILVCAILVPHLTLIGAAVSVAASVVLWNFLLWRDARQILRVDTSVFHSLVR